MDVSTCKNYILKMISIASVGQGPKTQSRFRAQYQVRIIGAIWNRFKTEVFSVPSLLLIFVYFLGAKLETRGHP